ncbi:hypothetical protein ACP70R_001672 [Stipagrostis hirtigluma subsp. patula]
MGSTTPNWLGFYPFSGAAAEAALNTPPHGEAAEPPKLEDFLGMHEPAAVAGRPFSGSAAPGGATSIGLSMIKSWLRSQPAPAGVESMALAMAPAPAESREGSRKMVDGDGAENGGAPVEAAAQRKVAVETLGQRTSVYRGVTKHRWTGRYEAHLWDNSCRREGQTRKGRQVYLGGYDKEEKAARAYDLAALKYWGPTTTINFPVSNYEKELEEMKHMNRQEYVASIRRTSSGFSRGASIYRGVTRHHQHGRWQARIGRVAGNKDLYLGTFSTQEEAAEAYDIAAIKFRGLNAVTNFDMSRYDVKSIIESSSLPVSSTNKRLKDVPDHLDSNSANKGHMAASNLVVTDAIDSYDQQHYGYSGSSPAAISAIPLQQYSNGHGHSRMWCKTEAEQVGVPIATAKNIHNLQHFDGVGCTHNFFQPPGLYEVTGYVDVPSQSVDSQSFFYNGGVGYSSAMGGGSYAMPVATLVDHGQGYRAVEYYEDKYDMPDYGDRNMYYSSQESPATSSRKEVGLEQGIRCDDWISPERIVAQNATNVTVCQQLPLFSWK